MSNNTPPRTVSELYPTRYLCADDLRGKRYTMTIERATVEQMRGFDGEQRWTAVLRFAGAQKAMILNKTQARAMHEITGTENVSEWVGAKVLIFPARTRNGKGTIIIERAPAATP